MLWGIASGIGIEKARSDVGNKIRKTGMVCIIRSPSTRWNSFPLETATVYASNKILHAIHLLWVIFLAN